MFILSGIFSFILCYWQGLIFILAEQRLIGHSRIYVTDFPDASHLLSQFEEKIEDIQGVEPPPSYPSTSGFNENPATTMTMEESRGKEVEMQEQDGHRMCSELNTAHDFVSGIMKIVPSDVDVSFPCLMSYFSEKCKLSAAYVCLEC
jgi:hypothetical protein